MKHALVLIALAGCELLADIPTPTVVPPGDAVIDTPDSMQAGCTDNAMCTMIGKPICDLTTNTCGGCVVDGDCPSNVCLMDGTCADPARFVYAAAGGSDTLCSMAQPCTLDTAVTMLTPTKDIVKLAPGTYSRATTLSMTIPGTIAGGGSTLNMSGAVGQFGIVAMGVPIRIIGLAMSVSTNNMGVRCLAAGGELHLSRVTITGANGAIYSSTCPVEIDRTSVMGASLYGLYANNTTATIRNSYFAEIGTMADYTIAAVHLNNITSGTVEHTTIANNTSMGPSGLRCPGSTLTIRNIITWGNVAPGIDPACTVSNSVVDPGYTGGSANISMDPLFISPATRNFHLMPSSPASGKGTPDAMFGIDGDGEDRPQPAGSNPDPGADEIP